MFIDLFIRALHGRDGRLGVQPSCAPHSKLLLVVYSLDFQTMDVPLGFDSNPARRGEHAAPREEYVPAFWRRHWSSSRALSTLHTEETRRPCLSRPAFASDGETCPSSL